MTHQSKHDHSDDSISRWLDADDDRQTLSDFDPSTDEQIRTADVQFVDALLSTQSGEAADQRAARVRQVMAAIEADEPAPLSKRPFARLRSGLAIAATLLIGFSLVWSQFNREAHASVVLREIGAATLENIDRIYHVRRADSKSDHQQNVEGKLYLRGREAFVLQCEDTVLGRTGSEYWLVPEMGTVLVAEDFEWMLAESDQSAAELELLKELSVDSRDVPIMQLSAVVELMQHDYHVSLKREPQQSPEEHLIVARLKDGSANLPDRIMLWANVGSRIIRRAQFSWEQRNSLILELAPSEQVPGAWYTHEAHHANERGIKRISRESL